MKKTYTSPVLALVEFTESQVILTSGFISEEDLLPNSVEKSDII